MPCRGQAAGHAQVEIRRIGQDGHVRLLGPRRRQQLPVFPVDPRNVSAPLPAARPPPGWPRPPPCARPPPAAVGPVQPKNSASGWSAPQLLHHQRSVQIARRLARRYQNFQLPFFSSLARAVRGHRALLQSNTGMSTDAGPTQIDRGRSRRPLSRRDDSPHQQVLLLLHPAHGGGGPAAVSQRPHRRHFAGHRGRCCRTVGLSLAPYLEKGNGKDGDVGHVRASRRSAPDSLSPAAT